ncbi:1-acyl-sn-glycerol-3-phosphate acyltransferase [Nocardia kruczakiae]|uniref:1-acyl-sn-glycerol-3-phosphate acyltransferase n=1 Tax=Nocardia kruczakiae TaxID=261477 RepID=UPI0007A44E2C|nr:1-acyl-sn-glycerol-3-phosphate acyltransferase [Nocardia kruczakiae]
MTDHAGQGAESAEEVAALAPRLNRPVSDIVDEIRSYHRGMWATHNQTVLRQWHALGRWMLRGYDRLVDEEELAKLHALDRGHSLVFLISHRSYLDEWVFPTALVELGVRAPFGFAGANLDFFPLGTIARRTGIVHIRRATNDVPVYKLALRSFIRTLVADRSNMIWSIEGGRSRTGKLRPPRLGLLRYVADAVEEQEGSDVLLVPVSILYDQLPTHEVEKMTAEAGGQNKTPENVRWLFGYLRGLQRRLGRVYVDFGEPIELRSRLKELKSDDAAETTAIERIAVEVSHRINRATPVAPTAVVCIALLAADRALTLDEMLETVEPLAEYLRARNWQTADAANLTDRATVRRALQDLEKTGVLSSFRGDTTVSGIRPSQHLVAAVYRNSAIHAVIERAIVEVAVQGSCTTNGAATALDDALRLRDLLKFEFFFAGRTEFVAALQSELDLISGGNTDLASIDAATAERCLDRVDLLVAPLMLRPFIDAYAVVAHQLAELGDSAEFDEPWFIERCLAVAHQWALQRRNAGAESTSAAMFHTALRLARHLGLLDGEQPGSGQRRAEFRREIRAIQDRIEQLSRRSVARR